jgi:hypothetical protein
MTDNVQMEGLKGIFDFAVYYAYVFQSIFKQNTKLRPLKKKNKNHISILPHCVSQN